MAVTSVRNVVLTPRGLESTLPKKNATPGIFSNINSKNRPWKKHDHDANACPQVDRNESIKEKLRLIKTRLQADDSLTDRTSTTDTARSNVTGVRLTDRHDSNVNPFVYFLSDDEVNEPLVGKDVIRDKMMGRRKLNKYAKLSRVNMHRSNVMTQPNYPTDVNLVINSPWKENKDISGEMHADISDDCGPTCTPVATFRRTRSDLFENEVTKTGRDLPERINLDYEGCYSERAPKLSACQSTDNAHVTRESICTLKLLEMPDISPFEKIRALGSPEFLTRECLSPCKQKSIKLKGTSFGIPGREETTLRPKTSYFSSPKPAVSFCSKRHNVSASESDFNIPDKSLSNLALPKIGIVSDSYDELLMKSVRAHFRSGSEFNSRRPTGPARSIVVPRFGPSSAVSDRSSKFTSSIASSTYIPTSQSDMENRTLDSDIDTESKSTTKSLLRNRYFKMIPPLHKDDYITRSLTMKDSHYGS